MGLLEDLIKQLKTKASQAVKSGKGFAKELKEHPFKTTSKIIADQSGINSLSEAFKKITSKGSENNGQLAEGLLDLSNIKKKGSGQTEARQYNPADTGFDIASAITFGLASGHEQGNRLSSKTPEEQVNPVKQQSIYVPGPGGSVIGGQGEVMPGYGMSSPTVSVPKNYLSMAQPQFVPQSKPQPDVGFIRGMINSLTGQPQPEGLGDVSQGRRTAYYAGATIPQVIMSKLGQTSPAEATAQQQQIESNRVLKEQRNQGLITPEFSTDLQSAVERMGNKNNPVSEEEKVFMYQRLAAKYPNQSTELKRIFFPQSSNYMEDILAMMNAGKR